MPIVELPNGVRLDFPDGMSDGDMVSAIESNFPEFSRAAQNAQPVDARRADNAIDAKQEADSLNDAQEVITSARAWRGAGAGRGSIQDPRRLDTKSESAGAGRGSVNPDMVDVDRTVLGTLGDVGVTAAKAAVQLPAAAAGVLDIPTFGKAGKTLEALGYKPQEAIAILNELYSPAQQQRNERVQKADGLVDTIKTALENPSTVAASILESIPQMLGGMGIARGVMKVASKASPALAGAIGEGVLGAGSAASEIRGQTEDGELTGKQALSALASGAGTTVLGAAGNKLNSKLGLADVDTMLASGKLGPAKSGFAKQVIGSGITEGAFEEMPQSAWEQMAQNFALDKPIMEGVGNAAGMGLVTGVAMGAAGGGASSIGNSPEQQIAKAIQDSVDGSTIDQSATDAAARAAMSPDMGIDPRLTAVSLRKPQIADIGGASSVDEATATFNAVTASGAADTQTLIDEADLGTPNTVAPNAGVGNPVGSGIAPASVAPLGAGSPEDVTAGGAVGRLDSTGESAVGATAVSLNEPVVGSNPIAVAKDQALLSRVPVDTAEEHLGPNGDGYQTEKSAQVKLQSVAASQPELDWKVEPLDNGRFRVAGYPKGEANVQQATPLSNDSPVGLAGEGARAGQSDPVAGGLPGVGYTAGGGVAPAVTQVVGDAAAARARTQAHLDRLNAQDPEANPKIVLGEPSEAEATQIGRAMTQVRDVFGVQANIVPFSDPNPDSVNGIQLGDTIYINTRGLTSNALNTGWHETHHVMQTIAEQDDKAGRTNTSAQRYRNKVDAIFDTMSEDGKLAYIADFLYSQEVDASDAVVAFKRTLPIKSKYWSASQKAELAAVRKEAARQFLGEDKTRKEMMADFVGNRATDRDFIISLAKADPKGFQAWAQKWLQTINELLDSLKGNGNNRQSKAVDSYVADLNKAKAVLRDAMVELKRSGALTAQENTDANFSKKGVIAEVAPNPDQPIAGDWKAMKDDEKTRATQHVVNKLIKRLMGVHGAEGWKVEFSSGVYEGATNPNFIVDAPDSATAEQLDELAKAIGYVLDQKAMVTFDESNTDSANVSGFVKVWLPEGFPNSKVQELRDWVREKAGISDDTLRDGALVFGNFRDPSTGTPFSGVSDVDFQNRIYSAVDTFEPDAWSFTVGGVEEFESKLIWPDSRDDYLKGTRYGSEASEVAAGGDSIRQTGDRGAWLRSLADEAGQAVKGWIDASPTGRAARDERNRKVADGLGRQGVEREYGTGIEGSTQAVGVHFSQERRSLLDSSYYGRGLKGAEKGRLDGRQNDDIRQRIFFYVDKGNGVVPESGVGGIKHTIQLNNLYDMQADPLGIVREAKGSTPEERTNARERAIKSAGFDGYVTDNGGNQKFAVLIGKHSISLDAPSYQMRESGNDLGAFNLDSYDYSDADSFKTDEEIERMLNEELDKEMGISRAKPPIPKSANAVDFSQVKPAAIKKAGIHPESIYPDMEYAPHPAGGVFARFKVNGTDYIAVVKDGQSPKVINNVTGNDPIKDANPNARGRAISYEFGKMSEKAKMDWNKRIAASADLISKRFDLYTAVSADARKRIADTWNAIAKNHDAFEFAKAEKPAGKNMVEVTQDIADKMLKDSRFQVTAIKLGPDARAFFGDGVHLKIKDTKTGIVSEADVEYSATDREMVMHTQDLEKGSGAGKAVYQVGQELAAAFRSQIKADPAGLLGVNNYRRTEQMFSGMLRSGKPETMQPGIGQRIYGWNERATKTEHAERNMVRTALAIARNVAEIFPQISDLRYDIKSAQFLYNDGENADGLVAGVLKSPDARAMSLSRSTLARAAITFDAINGNTVDAEDIAEPVLYSRKQKQIDERTEVQPMLDDLGRAIRSKQPGQIDKVMQRIAGMRQKFSTVNEASFQDELISIGSRAVDVARAAGASEEDARSAPVPIGATPHVMRMLGLDMSPLTASSRVIGKILNGRHSKDFAATTSAEFTDAIYHPVLVTSLQRDGEYEIVTSIIHPDDGSPESGFPVIFVVKRDAVFEGQRGENGQSMKPIKTHSIMSAYAKPSFWMVHLRKGMKEGKLLYANVGELQQLESKNPALGRVLLPKGASGQPDVSVKDTAAASLPSTSDGESLQSQRAKNLGSSETGLVSPSASQLTKDIAKSVMKGNVKGYGDLVKWVSSNHNGDADEMPMYQRRQTETPAFKKWFGDSKVVGANGKPLVVYHGTKADFNNFSLEKFGQTDGGWAGEGFYFAPNPGEASIYATSIASPYGNSTGANVMPVFLSANNPLEWRIGHDADRRIQNKRNELDAKAFLEWVQSQGYDSIHITSPDIGKVKGEDQWVVFKSEQVKSAIGNNGEFDGSNPDIRYSKRQSGLPEETKFQKARRILQDSFLHVKAIQDFLTARGGVVGEAQDVYRAEERMHGRTQELLNDFANNQLKPLTEKAVEYGIDLDELALYAYAKHAEERNRHISSINRTIGNAGSGMDDATAQNIIQMVELEGNKDKFDELHDMLMGITSTSRRVMLDEGLITQDEYDAWESQYENYIPLRGFENVDPEGNPKPGLGRGFTVKGKETIRAMGRNSRAGDLIENVIRDYERAVIRSERNQVAKVFLDLALTNPDPKLWEITPVKLKRKIGASGLVSHSQVNDTSSPDVLTLKVQGHEIHIKIKDELLLRAMKAIYKDETSGLERLLVHTLGTYTNLLRNTLTRYNPIFGGINAVRDAQMGAVSVFDELGAEGLKLYSKYYGPALAASFRKEAGIKGSGNMDKWLAEMRFAGGTTGGFQTRDLAEISSDLRTLMLQAGAAPRTKTEWIKSRTGYRAFQGTLKALEIIGSTSEDAARVSAYRAAREMGKTPAQAAAIAKNLTTNFNRKGEWGTALNSLYLFFNAGVQGSTRVLQALKKPRTRYLLAGLSGMSMGLALMAAGMGDDDDGEAYWDKIPDYEKERNLIIMLPPGADMEGAERVGTNGRYIKIPAPYGINIFMVMGYQLADLARYAKDPTQGVSPVKAGVNMASAVFGSMNPFGGAFDPSSGVNWALAAAPTAVDLPIQLGMEVNSFGRPVAPEKSVYDIKPDSERYTPKQAGGTAQRLAAWMNDVTGGNEARSGLIDVAPGTIENAVQAATGGLGMFVFDTFINLPTKMYSKADGHPVEITDRDIPLWRNFYAEVDGQTDLQKYYERSRKARNEYETAKAEAKAGVEREYTEEDEAMFVLGGLAESYSKSMSSLRKEEMEIADSKMSAGAKMVKRQGLNKQRQEIAREFNEEWVQAMKDLKNK